MPLLIFSQSRIFGFILILMTIVMGVAPACAAAGHIMIESVDGGGAKSKRSAYIIQHDRLKRTPRPTIIVLQGRGGNSLRNRLSLEDTSISRSTVMVYPEAADHANWDIHPTGEDRDARFIDQLVEKLIRNGVTDKHRIYLVGSSTGGIVALRLLCRDTPFFSGAAVLLSALPTSMAASCKPTRPTPFLFLAATKDAIFPYAGGKTDLANLKIDIQSSDASVAPFIAANGCSGKKSVTETPDRDPKDGTRVFLENYENCRAPVEFIRVENGGHNLPGSSKGLAPGLTNGLHNNDIDTNKTILDFFHRVGGAR